MSIFRVSIIVKTPLMNRIILISLLLLSFLPSFATHNRSGYITYKYVGGKEYEITVTTCTKLSSTAADRPELQICWGDGTRDTINRTSAIDDIMFDVRQNKYVYNHTYPADGVYHIEVYDPNRNAGVINILDAVNQPFCIVTELIISPFLGPNNSADFNYCPCPEYACTFQPYCYNPGAFDPDPNDSLSFEMVPCRGLKGCGGDRITCCYEECPFMSVPAVYKFLGTAPNLGGPASIDPQTGTLCWTSPDTQGEYNVAIKVTEWRKVGSTYAKIGWVTLDYQITVSGTCENNAPSVEDIKDTCIVAGTNLNFTVNATDPDPLDNLTLEAGGQPFHFSPDSASFTVPGNGVGNNLTGTFNWNTTCEHVSNTGYLITISAKDDDQGNTGPVQIPLSDYETFIIRVIPPKVIGVTASNAGASIVVTWTPQTTCSNANGYKIYRSNFPIVNTESCCDGSTPTDLGYSYVGTVDGINSSTFTDNSSLSVGQNYCYVVVLYYSDGSVSCPSDPACAQLKAEFPIMTRVSIDVTDAVLGTDTVAWFYPYELDTLIPPFNTGNFYYKLFSNFGSGLPTNLIHTTVISSSLPSLESVYFDTNLNTQSLQYTYKIELWHISTTAVETFVGVSTSASSILLTLTPNDNQIALSWTMNVPWSNYLYEVYRETPTGSGTFTLIDTTSLQTYTDTGLINGATYCYRVKGIGTYTAPEIPTPLINWSQEACAIPIDLTAPCPPVVAIEGDCENILNTLTWNNPNNSCADDVMSYNVYYASTDTGAFNLISTITVNSDTIFTHNNNGSIAGCYYVTAIDSAQYGNESVASNIVCVDNCPYYWLPNVFTPNGDGSNDLFVPFPYKYVESIDLHIYNRWGNLVFETTDPDIKWNGFSQENDKLLVEGVYYYVCKVNTIRLIGIDPVELHGFVHLFYDEKNVKK